MKLKGYKGFNGDLQCTPNGKIFQYKIGGEYREENAELCKSGFHFCENPLDVFGYYPPSESRFCEVEAAEVSSKKDSDSKRSCKSIKIGAEISLKSMCDAAVKFIFERVDWSDKKATNTGYQSAATNTGNRSAATNTGYRSAATNTGYRSAATNTGYRSAATNTGDQSAATNTGDQSAATNTGDQSAATNTGDQSAATNTGDQSAATNTGYRSAATNTGYRSAATNTGDQSAATNTGDQSAATNTGDQSAATVSGSNSIAIVTGKNSYAKGAIGCWLVLTERNSDYEILGVKAVKVDGKKIKSDTFYELVNGKIYEKDNKW